MKVHSLELRRTHAHSYRRGEWALVVGVVMVEPDNLSPRRCYAVRYPDGVVDYVVVDEAHHELRSAPGDPGQVGRGRE